MRRGKRNDNFWGVLDFETDPFLYGRIPFPFACGIYFGESDSYTALWERDNDKLIEKVLRVLYKLPRTVIYAHNGGKFDFFYLVEYANKGRCVVRNGRIFEMQIGNITLRDSWPLMPFALEEYRKTKIDYRIFEQGIRDQIQNKLRIQNYLFDDCKNLYDLIAGFKEILGPKDTIGSAAFYQMRKLGLEIERLDESHDETFRPFFFGGRVEAFKQGIFNEQYQYLDINSAYSDAMLRDHPHGCDYRVSKSFHPGKACSGQSFLRLLGHSQGALPLRAGDGTLDFPGDYLGEFFATGWEVLAGLETNTLRIDKILECWTPRNTINFSDFVNTFYPRKNKAKQDGDKISYLAYKYLLNSGYGKFAQNPRDFREYCLAPFGDYPDEKPAKYDDWSWETDYGATSLWSSPSYDGIGFYDVATGASITGFQRATLWRGICSSSQVLYCDTDAILCGRSKVRIGEGLGQWKCEGVAVESCIAGKKLYALKSDTPCFNGSKTKIASKGARLSYAQVKSLCQGATVSWSNPAPTFSAALGAQFVRRKIKATGE